MLYQATQTNHTYTAGKQYELDENCSRVRQYIAAGLLEPIQKPEAETRKRKVVRVKETK